MAWARETGVRNLIEVNLCDDANCTCASGLTSKPDYIDVRRNGIETVLYATVSAGIEQPIPVSGFPHFEEIANAINSCDGPIELESGEIVCGAIAQLRRQI